MQKWIISANGNMYDHVGAFNKWGYIDWRQNLSYNIGDIVYIYCTKPIKRIMFKTEVIKESMRVDEIVNDYDFWIDKNEYGKSNSERFVRLKLVNQVDTDRLSLDELKKYGLKNAPQRGMKVTKELEEYIDKYLRDDFSEGWFPEADISEDSYEGALININVNKYERSSIARKKCIEAKGCKCSICGFDFEKVYGDIGKGFIHIHHIVPLNKINKEYKVDYEKDLIPVCPNCHAMLHRRYNGKEISIDELKGFFKQIVNMNINK